MKPSFHRFRPATSLVARLIAPLSAAASLALVTGACTPDNSVKPGAPVLTEIVIIENGNPSFIKPDTGSCAAGVSDGLSCDPSMDTICRIGGANGDGGVDAGDNDGGGVDAGAVAGGPSGWCRCHDGLYFPACPFAPPISPPAWSCQPFAPTTGVLAVFDRLLDSAPFDPGDSGAVTDVATLAATPPPPTPVALSADYGSNGGSNFTVKPVLFAAVEACGPGFGLPATAFRADGPSVLLTPTPQLPVDAEVTISLLPARIRAKDGKTGFTSAGGVLGVGTISLVTGSFAASIAVPMGAPDDAGVPATTVPPDNTPVTISFTAPVPDSIVSHVTVKVDGVDATSSFVISSSGIAVTVAPMTDQTWPPSSTIEVAIDASAPDALGDTLGSNTPTPGTFITAAM